MNISFIGNPNKDTFREKLDKFIEKYNGFSSETARNIFTILEKHLLISNLSMAEYFLESSKYIEENAKITQQIDKLNKVYKLESEPK